MLISRSPRAAWRRFTAVAMASLPSKGTSTATSLNSQCAAPGEGRTARAPSTIVESSAGSAGLQMSMATRDMQVNSQLGNKAVLIAGPTASGKSALALELAQTHDAVIVNTDSMQVYRDLRVITARPTLAEEAEVPHRLYGHVDAAMSFSAGAWVTDSAKVLADARAQKRLPIFVGGSGLYFKSLTRGLSADAGSTRASSACSASTPSRVDPASAERL